MTTRRSSAPPKLKRPSRQVRVIPTAKPPSSLKTFRDGSKSTTPSVLIIDDEETIVLTWMEILRREGLSIGSASNAREAEKKFQEQEWDVIITDLRLVDEDGVAILHDIQRRAPNTISIVLTGFPTMESAISAIRAGVHDYLIKPCKVEDMLVSIRRGLAKREALQLDTIAKRHSMNEVKRLAREKQKLEAELRRLR